MGLRSSKPKPLKESSSSSLSLDPYSLGRPMLYPWEVSVFNLLSGSFASISRLPVDMIEEQEQDYAPSSGPPRTDLEDRPSIYCVNPSFDELKKITGFEVKVCLKCNYRVIVPLPIDTIILVVLRCT